MTPIDELKIFSSAGSNINDALRILAYASITEINLLLDKINYYIEHVNVLASNDSTYKDKKELQFKREFLENLQGILENEVNRRSNVTLFN